ncbi:Stage III sporulation protein E [Anaerohalosphaera lusitana]|uniref:Stage III sporulation protein E n=1 Tax=Anaerohalosphaera lusitana TaxID=1936003 RepID=A0A1U9NQ90_9BACT|nr:DNA translocase FtsK [Anaerohalosphaera lusitana]AQT69947.1 Stage III sporulation protein E [Anaerohalosphaera lusitana]
MNESEKDKLFDEAVRVVREADRGSVSLLQRRLGIGYARAARLINSLEEAGVIGAYRVGKAREVLKGKI